MKNVRKILALLLTAGLLTTALAACGDSGSSSLKNYNQNNTKLTFKNTSWNYDAQNDVWYQLGITYCASPKSKNQTMGIYVPGRYLKGKQNGKTYTCTPTRTGKKAAIVAPVNTPGYSAQAAPTKYSYTNIASYMKAGLIYLEAGMRGRETGAPWGVTDLKSAIRYYRFNKDKLPGDTNQIYTFGHSGGGAQSSLMGTTGDSPLYYPYLESIGAAMKDKNGKEISDSIAGAMCWCPITSLDLADESYEWNMGQFSSSGVRKKGTYTASLSQELAGEYPKSLNKLGLRDENGTKLKLEKSETGTCLSGTYYEYLLKVIETSLNHFLKDTTFPYTESPDFMAGMGRKGPAGGIGPAQKQGDRAEKTYATPEAYFEELNKNGAWVQYDKKTNTAKVLNLKGFIQNVKPATKDIGAFDDLNKSQAENMVFGTGGSPRHFDPILAELVKGSKYESSFAQDLKKTDSLGTDLQTRMNMYNPMFYISRHYDGYKSSRVAPHWRIHTGIEQGDTALCTEVNLAAALRQMKDVRDVEFTTVWGLGHTMAERKGNAETNFIQWVLQCTK